MMSKTIKRWGFFILIMGVVIALDQTIKLMVVDRLAVGESWEIVPALSRIIKITLSYNTGAAFGIFPMASTLFLVLAFITVGVFAILYPSLPDAAWLSRLSIALISGAALGNAIDRLRYDGRVVDYVNVQITPTMANVSNFADHMVTIGVILLLIDQFRLERMEAKAQAEAAAAEAALDEATALEGALPGTLESELPGDLVSEVAASDALPSTEDL